MNSKYSKFNQTISYYEHNDLGGGWEKIAGGKKRNVSDKTLCFFEGWQML